MHDILKKRRASVDERSDEVQRRIEGVLKEHSEYMYLSEDQLWRGLGNPIGRSAFKKILKNLEDNNKIIYHKGSILWRFESNDRG